SLRLWLITSPAGVCPLPFPPPLAGEVRVGRREMPRWSAERRDVPIARDVKTPRKRLACLASTQGASPAPASLGAPLPLARPQIGKEGGKGHKRLGCGRRRKTTGRRSYARMFEKLVGSARRQVG